MKRKRKSRARNKRIDRRGFTDTNQRENPIRNIPDTYVASIHRENSYHHISQLK
ncbi:hypothetical protein YC2023_114582 [Brassica napus]